MVSCSAPGCRNTPARTKALNVTYHKFPAVEKQRALWIKAMGRKDWTPTPNSFLCSEHFKDEDVDRTSYEKVRLRENSVPCIFGVDRPTEINKLKKSNNLRKLESDEADSSTPKSPIQDIPLNQNPAYTTVHNEARHDHLLCNSDLKEGKLVFVEEFDPLGSSLNSDSGEQKGEPNLTGALKILKGRHRCIPKSSMPRIPGIDFWVARMDLTPGILKYVLQIMASLGKTMDDSSKLSVLSVGSSKVEGLLEYDIGRDVVIGPHSLMTTVLATGLNKDWEFPVYLNFDETLSKDTWSELIQSMEDIEYRVVAVVTDLSTASEEIWRCLEVSPDDPFFQCASGRRIFTFTDAHESKSAMSKTILTKGLVLDGKYIDRSLFKALTEFYPLKPIQAELVTCPVISETVGELLIRHKPGDQESAVATGKLILTMSKWYDLMSVQDLDSTDSPYKSPFGFSNHSSSQYALLNDLASVIKTLRVNEDQDRLQRFQIGILITLASLSLIQKDYPNIKYFFTSKFSLSSLKQFFSKTCGNAQSRSPLKILDTVKLILLEKYPLLVQIQKDDAI